MEYVYAALLLHSAGQPITEDNLTKVLSAAGISPDPARVKALVAALSEVDIDAAIKEVSAVPVAASAAAAVPTAAEAPEAKPAPAKEKPEEEERKEGEEEALAGLGALFG